MAHIKMHTGFTLVEMLVTIAILVILMTLAVPSFTSLLASWKLKAVADNIFSGLQLARAEAIRQNTTAVFALEAATNNWLVTLSSSYDAAVPVTKSPCDVSVSNYLRRSCGEGGGVTNSANFTRVEFSSQGRVSAFSQSATTDASGAVTVVTVGASSPKVDLSAAGVVNSLSLRIETGGQVRQCDPVTPLPANARAGDPKYCENL